MAALIDASKIVKPFVPSLTHLASVKIAVPLFNKFEIGLLDKVFTDIQNENSAASHEDSQGHLEVTYNRAKEELLSIPAHLRERVLKAVHGLGYAAGQWCADHSNRLEFKMEKHAFYWRCDGTIDIPKTAQQLVLDENVSVRQRFQIACMYCMEKNIQTMWNEKEASGLAVSSENGGSIGLFWIGRMLAEIKIHWTQHLVGYLISAYPSPEVPKLSFAYLLQPEEREMFLNALEYVTNDGSLNHHRVLNESLCLLQYQLYSQNPRPVCTSFLPLLQPEERQKLSIFLQNAKFNDLRSYLSGVSKEEEEQILQINEGNNARKILCSCLIWPFQGLFLETAERVWDRIDVYDFQLLLIVIMIFKKNRKDFDYCQLLEGFWNRSPDHFRRSTERLPDLLQKMGICMNG